MGPLDFDNDPITFFDNLMQNSLRLQKVHLVDTLHCGGGGVVVRESNEPPHEQTHRRKKMKMKHYYELSIGGMHT